MASRKPVYLEFADGAIREFADGDTVENSELPIGTVIANTDNADPAESLGYGYWVALGTTTVGATTIYHFERAIP